MVSHAASHAAWLNGLPFPPPLKSALPYQLPLIVGGMGAREMEGFTNPASRPSAFASPGVSADRILAAVAESPKRSALWYIM